MSLSIQMDCGKMKCLKEKKGNASNSILLHPDQVVTLLGRIPVGTTGEKNREERTVHTFLKKWNLLLWPVY